MRKYTVYLAGPITGCTYAGCVDWRRDFSASMPECVECLSPMRGKGYLKDELAVQDSYPDTTMSTDKAITARDYFDCCRADVIVANFLGATRASIGTAMEVAWGFSKHTPIVCIMEKTVPGRHISELDSAWLAGIVDGEGCVHIGKNKKKTISYQPRIAVSMTCKKVIDRLVALTGYGSCRPCRVKEGRKLIWEWKCVGQQAADILRHIWPHLIVKRQQAALCIELAESLAVNSNCPEKGQQGFQTKTQEVIIYEAELFERWQQAQAGENTLYVQPDCFSNIHDHGMIREAIDFRVDSIAEAKMVVQAILDTKNVL